MARVGRRLRAAVNPVSTGFAEWWCTSALRRAVLRRQERRHRISRRGRRSPG
ncbi:hypothetical protein O2V63_06190 [Modestobacter sp. VKM Ac-2977]|uniref:hypothetical protein n=1 Tax=Modestobacter sp. VKM Ac-2977 TaxID=3004131 RepID=UPI0022AB25FD|nr:hypothetical protein [Modestobacter sp. VKM Ac-2977]MCZ2819913.1 hypothetical protein [Modestobacter sp. VKM Ac-2977]